MHVGEKGVERKSCEEEKMRGKLTMIGNPSVSYLLCERGGQGLGYRVKPRSTITTTLTDNPTYEL